MTRPSCLSCFTILLKFLHSQGSAWGKMWVLIHTICYAPSIQCSHFLVRVCLKIVPHFVSLLIWSIPQVAVVTVAFPATPLLLARARICISASHSREDLIKGLEVKHTHSLICVTNYVAWCNILHCTDCYAGYRTKFHVNFAGYQQSWWPCGYQILPGWARKDHGCWQTEEDSMNNGKNSDAVVLGWQGHLGVHHMPQFGLSVHLWALFSCPFVSGEI